MGALFGTVNPGDVISSNLFNQVLSAVNDLEQRVANLEKGTVASTGTIIDHFDPQDQQNVGQVLTIYGTFDFPPAANIVTIDGVAVSNFRAGSNNLNLSFIIPSAITIPISGSKTTTIVISNSKGTDKKSYLLLAPVASTVPAPTITSVVDFTTGATILTTNKEARITGTNFAGTPANNIITLTLQIGATQIVYPKTGQPAFTIDAANTSTTQIGVTLPAIAEIGVGSSVPATLQVGVGSAVPAAFGVTIINAG